MDSKINIDLLIKYIKKISSEKENRIVDDWLRESDENRSNYESFLFYWNSAGILSTKLDLEIESVWETISAKTFKKVNGRSQKQKKLFFLKIAASIVLLVGVVWTLSYFLSDPFAVISNKVTYATNDEIKKVVLTDNSVVWLNKNSVLTAPSEFSDNFRQVILEGEAFFEIKRDPGRPFLVKTYHTVCEVLGTSFNIKSDPEQKTVCITVASGKVAFYSQSDKNKMIVLKKDDVGFYSPAEESVEKVSNTNINYLSWKTRKLEFHETSLYQVCKDLNECYNANIRIDSLPEKQSVFTGTFENAGLQEVLYVIGLTLELKFINSTSGYEVHLNDTLVD